MTLQLYQIYVITNITYLYHLYYLLNILVFLDLTQFNDFTFDNIPVAQNGVYTMEFWVFSEDLTDITSGVTIIWDKHVSIALLKTSSNKLGAYCFPQAYLDDLKGKTGTGITTLFSTSRNAFLSEMDPVPGLGNWYWVRCAVSFMLEQYYATGTNIAPVMQTLKPEILYDLVQNDVPFRKYFNGNEQVSLYVSGAKSHTKKIYLRNMYLFNDYLPPLYDFRYM